MTTCPISKLRIRVYLKLEIGIRVEWCFLHHMMITIDIILKETIKYVETQIIAYMYIINNII